MKTHAIIPIFLPHEGCPNDCIFCNQRRITARSAAPTPEQAIETAETWLSTLPPACPPPGQTPSFPFTIEMAFYGGSFTGLPPEEQIRYLSIAKQYKEAGRIHRIRLSTRPDYIDEEILTRLGSYQVDLIELGVQSFDDQVLSLSRRGCTSRAAFESSRLIRAMGFDLGIQLMIGLPGDSYEKAVDSARKAAGLSPAVARLYPTVVLEDTPLHQMYRAGRFQPFSQEEMLRTAKDMYLILENAGVQIIRVGLKSSDLMGSMRSAAESGYHPAFRHLVEGEIARDRLEDSLARLVLNEKAKGGKTPGRVACYSNPASFSNMVGHKKCNRNYFEKKYPEIRFHFRVRQSLADYVYLVERP